MTKEQEIFRDSFAPTLIIFTQWVLQEADKRKADKLYFLARDAYMSYVAADYLVKRNGLNIECRYLEGSRIAWRTAEYHLLSDDAILDKICIGGVYVTLRKILMRGGLTGEEINRYAKDKGIEEELDQALTYSQAREYRHILKKEESFFTLIRKHSLKAYDLTIRYFKQEGLLDRGKIYIVDSGWIGSMQQTLSNLTGKEVEGFYFGLYELPAKADRTKYHTYFFAPYRDILKKASFNNCLFEAVFSSGEGMTTGYKEEQNRIISVKETNNNPNKDRILENVELLKSLLTDTEYINQILTAESDIYTRRLQRVMSHPSRDEAECIGSYRFSDDVNQESIQDIAVHLSISEIRNTHALKRAMIMSGHSSSVLKDSAWLEGSIVRCGRHTDYHLWHCRWYKRMVYMRKQIKRRG